MVPSLLAAAGAPIRVVLGYVSTARVNLALEQGEVDGSFTVGNGLASAHGAGEQVTPIVQTGGALSGRAAYRATSIRAEPRSRCSSW